MEKKHPKEGNFQKNNNPFKDDFFPLDREDYNENKMIQSSNVFIDKFRDKVLDENLMKETALENKIGQIRGNNILKRSSSRIPSTKDIKIFNIEKSLKEKGVFGNSGEENLIIRKLPEITEEQYYQLQYSIVNIDMLTKLYNYLNSINCNFKDTSCGSSIGGLTPLTYLIESYYRVDKEMCDKMNDKYNLLKPYIFNYREINGDGNCFYRAVIFRYLEILILNQRIEILRKFVYNVVQCFNSEELNKRRVIKNIDIKPELTFKILFLIVDLLKNNMIKEAHQILVKSFSTCKKFDYAIILYFRYILYEFIKKNENKKYTNSFPVKIGNLLPTQFETDNGEFSFDSFYQNYLLKFFTEAEKIIIYLTPFVLGIELNIIVFDFIGEDIIQKFVWEGESEIKIDEVISLLNIKNHYEIIYTKKDNEKYKSLFEIYENNQKSIFLLEIEKYLIKKNEDEIIDEKKSNIDPNKNNQVNFKKNEIQNINNLINSQDNANNTPDFNNIDNNTKNINNLENNDINDNKNINNNNSNNQNFNINCNNNFNNIHLNNNINYINNNEKNIINENNTYEKEYKNNNILNNKNNPNIQNNNTTFYITNIDNNSITTKSKTSVIPKNKNMNNYFNLNENFEDKKQQEKNINYLDEKNNLAYNNYFSYNNEPNLFIPKTQIKNNNLKENQKFKNEFYNINNNINDNSNKSNNVNNKKVIICDRCKKKTELNYIEIPLCEKCFKQRLFKNYLNCIQKKFSPIENIYMEFNSKIYYLDDLIKIFNKNFEKKIDRNLIIENIQKKECLFFEEHPDTAEKLPCGCKLCDHLIIYFETNFEFSTHFICKCLVEYNRPLMLELGTLFLENRRISSKIIHYFQNRLDQFCCLNGENIINNNNIQIIKDKICIDSEQMNGVKLNKFLSNLIHKTCKDHKISTKFYCQICNINHLIKV